ETFCDLKIFFHPRDHKQLLVLLRRLRQRVKFSRHVSARKQKVAARVRSAFFGSEPESRARLPAFFWTESVFQLQQIPGYRGNRAWLLPRDGESANCAPVAAAADPNSGASSADLHSAARRRVGMAAGRPDLRSAGRLE